MGLIGRNSFCGIQDVVLGAGTFNVIGFENLGVLCSGNIRIFGVFFKV